MRYGTRRFLYCDHHAHPAYRRKQMRRFKLVHDHVHSVLIDWDGHQLSAILRRQFLAKLVLLMEALRVQKTGRYFR
jgi:hypothetical protein